MENKKCYTCKNWKKEQAELMYSKFYGICTSNELKFHIQNLADCVVLDRENISDKHMGVNRFENQNNQVPIGVKNTSRYCLVTSDLFGCINHKRKS